MRHSTAIGKAMKSAKAKTTFKHNPNMSAKSGRSTNWAVRDQRLTTGRFNQFAD